ncbi:undecaprenyl diphosphate synthase family protein [Acidithiobacillus ferrivorans]|uniref:Dihydroorotate dehydrogenase n=1 Tax=Acidithiobacillus ferrivorans TaxID=160808 RepID=A0A1B9BYM6_9PROT|nr:undecaprenyl diphosphate synthase family protein [Acidithiobacillus ferrivorans]MBN6742772.1 undecaprenyl diphosphate synthase family protein [Acidithiobacillus sp. MC6.1]OCB02815.1 dihydroorotate dehydrogenase [Acidithiobacillus ferrivorans]QQD71673.1 undecaprenyl diphosphate synthase family protein [Acidithiobacillus ferrivorans]
MTKRIFPKHVGFIPDGNRRWATSHGLQKESGYARGINPGLLLFDKCKEYGINEISIYGFTKDNTKRAAVQTVAFRRACVAFAFEVVQRGAALLVVGDETSLQFPAELKKFRQRHGSGMKVNLLVNYGWEWDLAGLSCAALRSSDISRMDLIVRWGGRRRLSGFLPVQSVYADFYIRDEYWPDFEIEHFDHALDWYKKQDRTLGG